MANVYWVGNTGNWSDTAHWSTTSGGSGGAALPTVADYARFDANSLTATSIITFDTDIQILGLWATSLSQDLELNFNGKTINSNLWSIYGLTKTVTLTGNGATLHFGSGGAGMTFNTVTVDLENSPLICDGSFGNISLSTVTDINNSIPTFKSLVLSYTVAGTHATILNNPIGFTDSIDIQRGATANSILTINVIDCVLPTITNDGRLEITAPDYSLGTVACGDGATIYATDDLNINTLTMLDDYYILLANASTLTLNTASLSVNGTNTIETTVSGEQSFINHRYGLVETNNVTISDVMLTGNATWYVGDNSTQNSDAIGFLFRNKPTSKGKRLYAKIYAKTGDFIDRIDNIVGGVQINRGVNSVAQEVSVKLAADVESLDETNLLRHFNKIRIYVEDNEYPEGQIVFIGYIDSYDISYSDNTVTLSVLGYDATLDDYLIKEALAAFTSQLTTDGYTIVGPVAKGLSPALYAYQTFTTGASTTGLDAFSFWAKNNTGGDISLELKVFDNPVDAKDLSSVNDIGSLTTTFLSSSDVYKEQVFTFASTIPVSASTTYYIRVNPSDQIFFYVDTAGTDMALYSESSGWLSENDSFKYTAYQTTGATTFSYNSTDVGQMVRNIIDSAGGQGCGIEYTVASIPDVGVVASYTFNSSTALEALNKCLEMAGESWFWYVDPSTNLLYFNQLTDTTIDHYLNIGSEIIDINVEKRTKNIVSDVYFTGGNTGASLLYNRYTNTSTVDNWTYRAKRMSDGRVTVDATASKLAQTTLAHGATPEIMVSLLIVDNTASGKGYDIESFKLGQYVKINNANASGSSLWDSAVFDQDYWDYNLAKLHTIPLEIVAINWSFDTVRLTLGAFSDNYFATLEQTKRGVIQLETVDTPSIPS